jgi:hypothetical protein
MSEQPVEPSPLDELLVAVERFRRRMRESGVPPAEVEDFLLRLRRGCDSLELEFSTVAAGFAATYDDDMQCDPSPIAWLRNNCHMTGHAAAAAISVGEAAAELAVTTDAMTEGRVGFAHLASMAQTKQAVAASGATLDEARLLRKAEKQTPNEFRKSCAHARHAADSVAFLAEQRQDIEARFLELRSLGDNGCMWIRGFLDAAGAATVRAALLPLAAFRGAEDDRLFSQRLADALVDVASHALDTDVPGAGRPKVPQVQVTTTLETLMNLPGAPAAEMVGGSLVSTATVERLACEANIRRILLGPDSAVIDVGRARRLPAPATRRVVELRDKRCVYPGCPNDRWLDIHHLVHWIRGGATEAGNLCLVCKKHHAKVHELGFQLVRIVETGEITVIPPPGLDEPSIRGPGGPVAA